MGTAAFNISTGLTRARRRNDRQQNGFACAHRNKCLGLWQRRGIVQVEESLIHGHRPDCPSKNWHSWNNSYRACTHPRTFSRNPPHRPLWHDGHGMCPTPSRWSRRAALAPKRNCHRQAHARLLHWRQELGSEHFTAELLRLGANCNSARGSSTARWRPADQPSRSLPRNDRKSPATH
jgi:hypothetical protein